MSGADEDLINLSKIHEESDIPANTQPVRMMQEVVDGEPDPFSEIKEMHHVEHPTHHKKEPPQIYNTNIEATTLEEVPDIRIPHKEPLQEQKRSKPATFGDGLEETVKDEQEKAITPSDAAAFLAITKLMFGDEGNNWYPAQRVRYISNRNLEEHRIRKTATGWAMDAERLVQSSEPTTLGEVLLGIKNEISRDRPITLADAKFIREAEENENPGRVIERGGFADHALAAVPKPEQEVLEEKRFAQPQ